MSLSFGCAICAKAFDDRKIVCATQCGHVYHRDCLSQWVLIRHRQYQTANCPKCRCTLTSRFLQLYLHQVTTDSATDNSDDSDNNSFSLFDSSGGENTPDMFDSMSPNLSDLSPSDDDDFIPIIPSQNRLANSNRVTELTPQSIFQYSSDEEEPSGVIPDVSGVNNNELLDISPAERIAQRYLNGIETFVSEQENQRTSNDLEELPDNHDVGTRLRERFQAHLNRRRFLEPTSPLSPLSDFFRPTSRLGRLSRFMPNHERFSQHILASDPVEENLRAPDVVEVSPAHDDMILSPEMRTGRQPERTIRLFANIPSTTTRSMN